MKNINLLKTHFALFLILVFSYFASAQKTYYPPAGAWERRTPAQARMDAAKLTEAVDFAVASESKAPRNLALAHYQTFGREPFGEAIGHFKERGAPTGIVIRNGYIVAEWGEPARVDMTFSVTKSFLSATVGLALDRRLIRSLQDRASDYAAPVAVYKPNERADAPEEFGKSRFIELFDTEHNRQITWEQLLREDERLGGRALGETRLG